MKILGSLLNNIGFICLLICLVLLGAQYVLGSGADGVSVAGMAMSSGAVNNMFNGVFTSENVIIRFVVDHLAGCAIGSLAVMLLGGWIRKAAK